MGKTLPKLAGNYFDWEAEGSLTVPAAIGGIVAVAGTHDDGPVNTPVLCDWPTFRKMFGTSATELSRGVFFALKGEGLNGRGGASQVLVIRQAGAAMAKATHQFQNTTPAGALTITAKNFGTRANNYRVTIQAGAAVGTKDLLLLDGALVVETYNFAQADIAGLAAEINLLSKRIAATADIDGVALANVASVALAGGNDGAVLIGSDWDATLALLDVNRWSIFAPANLTDDTIRATVVAWAVNRNSLGARCYLVVGGASGETASDVADAVTRSDDINDWNVLNLGAATIHDNAFDRDVSTAEYAPRVAGAMAARGEKLDLIYVRFTDCTLVSGPSLDGQEACLDGGVTTFSSDTNQDAPVFIREGVTTYTDDSQSPVDDDGNKKYPVRFANGTKAYASVKNVRIQHGIELDANEWSAAGNVLGELPVSDRSRSIVVGHYKTLYQTRQDAQILQPGWSVSIDADATVDAGGDDSDAIFVSHGFHPTRSTRLLMNTARMG